MPPRKLGLLLSTAPTDKSIEMVVGLAEAAVRQRIEVDADPALGVEAAVLAAADRDDGPRPIDDRPGDPREQGGRRGVRPVGLLDRDDHPTRHRRLQAPDGGW